MSDKLESRLKEMESVFPITNDRELASALRFIINEESAKIDENNVDLISEASELLLNISGVTETETDNISSELLSDFLSNSETRTVRKAVKPGIKFTAMRKVAMFAFTTLTAVALLVTLNGNVRAAIKNTFVTWMRELAIIDFSDDETVTTKEETPQAILSEKYYIKANEVPDGYTFDVKNTDGDSTLYTYKNGSDFVVVEIIPTDPAGVIHSTEKHQYSEIYIGKTEVYMFYNEDERTGSIVFGNSNVTVIVGGVADRDVLIDFAEEIIED